MTRRPTPRTSTAGRPRGIASETAYIAARGRGLADADSLIGFSDRYLSYPPDLRSAYLKGIADALRAYAAGYDEATH